MESGRGPAPHSHSTHPPSLMARYDYDRRTGRGYPYDNDDNSYRYGTRRSRYDGDDSLGDERRRLERNFEGYERDGGDVRWDYAGRGPEDNVRNYGRDRNLRDREDLDRGSRYDDDRRYSGARYDDDSYRRSSSDEDYLQDRYDRDYNRDYVRDFGDHNGYVGRYERGPHSGRGPEGYTRSAERMIEQVNERLTDDHRVNASRIQVTAENGEVTLNGTVTDRSQKRRAEDIAESVRGVDDVHNRLTIQDED